MMLGMMMVIMALVVAPRVSTLVEDMESGANTLHNLAALLLWGAWRLGQDHGEPSLMHLQLGVTPCLEEDSIIVFLMFCGGLGVCANARVEDI